MKHILLLVSLFGLHLLQGQQQGSTPVSGVTPIFKNQVVSDSPQKALKSTKATAVPDSPGLISTGNSDEIGVTQGELSVSLSGAATYSIPMATPPGINGVVPSVSLVYTSQGGNGVAGYGWNIGGLSTISRVPSTTFHDTYIDPVDFDALDRFALDGQRLLLKTGAYGTDNAEYQTETYSNLKITSHGTNSYGNGPAYFKVKYPNGAIAHYGNSKDSNTPTTYAITFRENPHGLRIYYQYTKTNHTLYISKITYGDKKKIPTRNKISFEYKSRARPEQGYVGGMAVINSKLLQAIRVKGAGVGYRNYLLSHDLTSLAYQRLISLTEQNGDGSKSYNPTLFSYENTPKTFTTTKLQTTLSVQQINQHNAQVVSADFTGDGHMDFIVYPNGVAQNNPKDRYWLFTDLESTTAPQMGLAHHVGKFETLFPVKWLNYNEKLMPMKGWVVANDTKNGYKLTTYSVGTISAIYKQNERAFFWPDPTTIPTGHTVYGGKGQLVSGDFNGDGITDIMALKTKNIFKKCIRLGCSDYITPTTPSKTVLFVDMDPRETDFYATITGELADALGEHTQVKVADVTGDGKSNLLVFDNGKVSVYGLTYTKQLQLLWQMMDSHISVERPILLGDYNGDGKTDMIIPKGYGYHYARYTATGEGFVKADAYYTLEYKENKDKSPGLLNHSDYFVQQLLAVDMNHDGKTDLVALESKKYSDNPMTYTVTIYGKHDTFELDATKVFNGGEKYPLPIFLTNESLNPYLELGIISDDQIVHLAYRKDFGQEKLLRKITRGDGVSHGISYTALTTTPTSFYPEPLPPYQEDPYHHKYPYTDIGIQPGFQVVSRINRGSREQRYGYYGGVSHQEGLGFLGFQSVAKTSEYIQDIPPITTISYHDPALRGALTERYTMAGLPWSIKQPPSEFISKTTHTYQVQLLPEKVFSLKNITTKALNSLEGTLATVNNTFNDYGLITATNSTLSHNGAVQQTTTTAFTYENSPGGTPYYMGRLLEKTQSVTAYGDTFSSEERYTYNTAGTVNQWEKTGHQTDALTQTMTYDSFGNRTSETLSAAGAAPRTTAYQYDNTGRFLIAATDEQGLQTQYSYDSGTGWLLSTTDPYGRQTSYSYDTWGGLTQTTDYLGNHTLQQYSKTSNTYTVSQSGDDGSYSSIEYNLYGHPIKAGVKKGNEMVWQLTHYDPIGRVVKQSEPYLEKAKQWNTIQYDAYGRIVQQLAYTGKATDITYNGLTTTLNDGLQTITTTKDAMGNVITHTDNGGSISYTYYANGHLKQSDYDGVVVSTQQDGWGRKTQLTDPSAGTYTYEYTAFGELLEQTTPKGSTTYTYDDTGKLIQKEISGDATDMITNYNYDPQTGQLISEQTLSDGQAFTHSYAYDSYQRLSSSIEQTPYLQVETQWQYDGFGRVNKEGYTAVDNSSGKTLTHQVQHHYNNGQPWKITDNATGALLWETKSVDAWGQLTEGVYGNGISVTQQYDSYGFPMLYSHDKQTGDGDENMLLLEYAFTPQRGTLTSRYSSLFNFQETFAYDSLDRLTEITDNNGSQEQQYDTWGRITHHPEIGDYTYSNTHPYQTTQIDLTLQGHDYYTERGRQVLHYNAFKKPVSIEVEGKERIDFSYNPAQGRTAMFYGSDAENSTERPLQKYYSTDGSIEIKTNTITGETAFIRYIGGDAYSAPLFLKSDGTDSQYLYLHRDYLGSIIAITDQNATLLEKRHFDAWGNIVKLQDGQDTDLDVLTVLDRGYTGHEHLQGVGLIHMNGRLYDPMLRRFLAPDNYVQDPYNTQNFNRYGYVLNNPLMYSDPSGEFWHIVIGAFVGGVVNLVANWDSIDNFWEGAAAFGVGAGAGAATTATGGAGASFLGVAGISAAGGAVTMGTNSIIGQTGNGVGLGDVNWGQVGESALIGTVSGFAGGAVGHWSASSSTLVNGINSPILRTMATAPLTSGAGHITGGTVSGLFKGQSLNTAFGNSFEGLGKSMVIGMSIGVAATVGVSYANGISPVTGRAIAAKGSSQLAKYSGILRDAAKFKGNHGLGRGTASEALELGKAWVGKGYNTSNNGRFFISENGLRQFQIPNYKPQLGKFQSNFYWKNAGQKQWQSNGHFDIIK